MTKKILFGMILLLLTFGILYGCEEAKTTSGGSSSKQTSSSGDQLKIKEFETSQELKKFNSVQEIIDYLEKNTEQSNYYYGGIRGMALEERALGDMGVAKSAAPSATSSDGGRAAEYSKTNVQVEGVDEADFIKNDDKYIYIISGNKLVIMDAYPAENAKILSKTELKGTPMNLFVNGDRLIVFSVDNDNGYVIPLYDYLPQPRYSPATHVYVYDVADKTEPELIKDFSINGNYFESRMIGDYVYFITKDDVYYFNRYVDLPVIMEKSNVILSPNVYYFDNPEQNYVFHTIASLNIKDPEKINAKTFMMGYSNTLFVSENNIYISYQKNLPYRYYQEENENRFYKVIVPLLSEDAQSEIEDIKDSDLNAYDKWQRISNVLEETYDKMEENEKNKLVEKIRDAVDEYEAKLEIERRKTIIQKIAIEEGEIEYVAKGEVSGYLLNQFSMDEFAGNLRVATTTEIWAGKSEMYNNVFVLDKDMNQIGALEDIAPDERIYSTRFIGDRLYMVTFKRIDPFFVIDLSDAENPKILGKLKIPGFSDYLHPYDENHIMGIGKETETNEWGGVSTGALKLALFDVSDVEAPKQVDKFEIGEAGTDSEALQEHKAFLFDRKKNLLVIPVREVKERYRDSRYGYYRNRIWQGAYVFELSEEGFELKGKLSHSEAEEGDEWYYGSPNAVRRSLYMDDVLYTVSAKKILMNDLNDLEEINEVELPFKQEYYPVPLYR